MQPYERRRLFFFLLLLFTIVVFGTRYLIVTLGWYGGQTDPPVQEENVLESQPEFNVDGSPSSFTNVQLNAAETMVRTFIQLYTQHDLQQSEEWLQSISPYLHPSYQQGVQLEVDQARPTQLVTKTNFKEINQLTCEPQSQQVHCYLDVVTESINQEGEATPVERVYEVILSLHANEWKVEGLHIHGSFD